MFGNRSICPITRKMFHRFSKETHQCECGKWERGYKPKTVNPNARERGECQICERQFSMIGGGMGHHGYKRPGIGFIVGDCMAVGHKPFPATSALVLYRAALVRMQEREAELMELYRTETKGLPYECSTGYGRTRVAYPMTILATATSAYHTAFRRGGSWHQLPSFPALQTSLMQACASKIADIRREITRVDGRMAKAATMV